MTARAGAIAGNCSATPLWTSPPDVPPKPVEDEAVPLRTGMDLGWILGEMFITPLARLGSIAVDDEADDKVMAAFCSLTLARDVLTIRLGAVKLSSGECARDEVGLVDGCDAPSDGSRPIEPRYCCKEAMGGKRRSGSSPCAIELSERVAPNSCLPADKKGRL